MTCFALNCVVHLKNASDLALSLGFLCKLVSFKLCVEENGTNHVGILKAVVQFLNSWGRKDLRFSLVSLK